ncbi:hypothetical protein FNF28_02989 [Cafeteria roenbergensis]|uniref:Uncharacterized protein n=1 Tax=Cafeteria roenbergensis TaxID=33653 RepID=A0A5A8DQK9_CAFRO|nr:hypothetical protein FNF28_02989 [Cafeteria roenbergensis]
MSAADGSESPALWLPSNVPRKDLLRDKIRAKLRAVDEAVLRDTAARRAARRRKANGRTAASLPASPPRQGAAASGAHPELPPGTKTGSAGAGAAAGASLSAHGPPDGGSSRPRRSRSSAAASGLHTPASLRGGAEEVAAGARHQSRSRMASEAGVGDPALESRLDAGGPVDDVDETAARYAHESATRASLAAKPGRVACPGAPVPSPEQARKAREARQLIRALRKGSERLEQRLELGILRGERR